jgi:hypothetical protein
VALVLRERARRITCCRNSLHAHRRIETVARHSSIDDVETRLAFVEANFKIETARRLAKRRGAPFDIEDAVGRGAGDGCEDAFARAADGQVGEMRKDRITEMKERQAQFVQPVIRVGRRKLESAV